MQCVGAFGSFPSSTFVNNNFSNIFDGYCSVGHKMSNER